MIERRAYLGIVFAALGEQAVFHDPHSREKLQRETVQARY